MNLNIVSLDTFSKDVKKLYKKYKNLLNDLKLLQKRLQDDPKAGIELGKGCYKIRLANSSIPTGKSGGFRIIYYYLDHQNNLYLMTMFSKTELENISEDKLLDLLHKNGLETPK
ncbi:MAG: hypothetical protein U9N52_12855 [Campylobacterota bacterium]|nr:hypothetical protein [Campylobacterota bacterium]